MEASGGLNQKESPGVKTELPEVWIQAVFLIGTGYYSMVCRPCESVFSYFSGYGNDVAPHYIFMLHYAILI